MQLLLASEVTTALRVYSETTEPKAQFLVIDMFNYEISVFFGPKSDGHTVQKEVHSPTSPVGSNL